MTIIIIIIIIVFIIIVVVVVVVVIIYSQFIYRSWTQVYQRDSHNIIAQHNVTI